MSKKLAASIVLILGFLVGGFILWRGSYSRPETNLSSGFTVNPVNIDVINEKYRFDIQLGELGSEHTHMSLLFFIEGQKLDFSEDKYQLQAPHVHFENGDGVTVHKHATGVNLPFLFATFDIRINNECFMPSIAKEYCSDGEKALTFMVNGEKLDDIFSYELKEGDRILVNYGSEADKELKEKFNAIPEHPYKK